MSDRERLCQAVKLIAWSSIFIYLDVNLGTLNILPNWAGYMMMLRALPLLSEEETSAALLHPLGVALAVWCGIDWLTVLFGITFDANGIGMIITVISYVMTAVSMYFHFQLLTNLANAAEKYNCSQSGKILRLRTVNTVLILLLNLPLPWYEIEAVALILLVAMAVVTIWICRVLFSLKKELESGQL